MVGLFFGGTPDGTGGRDKEVDHKADRYGPQPHQCRYIGPLNTPNVGTSKAKNGTSYCNVGTLSLVCRYITQRKHMKQVTTREFLNNWTTLIEELPFEVIDGRTKKIVAVVTQPQTQVPEITNSDMQPAGEGVWRKPFLPYSKDFQNTRNKDKKVK